MAAPPNGQGVVHVAPAPHSCKAGALQGSAATAGFGQLPHRLLAHSISTCRQAASSQLTCQHMLQKHCCKAVGYAWACGTQKHATGLCWSHGGCRSQPPSVRVALHEELLDGHMCFCSMHGCSHSCLQCSHPGSLGSSSIRSCNDLKRALPVYRFPCHLAFQIVFVQKHSEDS